MNKVMEAPEKIYLVNDDLNIKRDWYRTKQIGFETTEYTRTDAFIEKTIKYIQLNWIWNTKMIEDFKNYIKEK